MLEVIKNTHNVEGYDLPEQGIASTKPFTGEPITMKDIEQLAEKMDAMSIKRPALDIKASQETIEWLLKDIPRSQIAINGHGSFVDGVLILVDETIIRGYFKVGNQLYSAHMPGIEADPKVLFPLEELPILSTMKTPYLNHMYF